MSPVASLMPMMSTPYWFATGERFTTQVVPTTTTLTQLMPSPRGTLSYDGCCNLPGMWLFSGSVMNRTYIIRRCLGRCFWLSSLRPYFGAGWRLPACSRSLGEAGQNRRDLRCLQVVDQTVDYILMSVKEPKTRFAPPGDTG